MTILSRQMSCERMHFFYLQDTAKRPDVHLKAMARFTEHFWGDVVGGSTQGLLSLAVIFNLGRKAEIPFGKSGMLHH